MSFILDALKRSENERQQQGNAEFSSVPTGSDSPRSSRWLWLLGVLLAVNLAVLLGILLRPDRQPTAMTAMPPAEESISLPLPTDKAADSPAGFAERVAEAREEQSVMAPAAASTPAPAPEPQRSNTSQSASVPTIDQLRLDGSLQIAELHLDIHVYSEVPGERFVFINTNKHRERSQLPEGPVVREITPAGVILDYQGQTFLLPRE
ncbi:MAG: general secretion pathway protein GspB [Woeseiaceae bacterium]|jgi:general secretion pathway protein B